jgi:hypothetical protein
MTQTIKPYEAYGRMSDEAVLIIANAVQTAMTGNFNFPNLPVDLAALKSDIERFAALMAESQDGSKKVIAERNKQRDVVVKKLRLLGRYVEVHCNNDMAIFKSSGLQPALTTKARPQDLSLNIRSFEHGELSGTIVVRLKAVPEAICYELRYAADGSRFRADSMLQGDG